MKTYLTAEISEALGCAKGEAPALVLRTADSQGRAYGGFQWPTEAGSLVEAPDWDPDPVCGYGLHGALWGQGDGHLLNWSSNALWYVVAARSADIINLNGKVKFPRCWVLFVGDQKGATDYIRARGARDSVIGATFEGGDFSNLEGGNFSTLKGGNYSNLKGGEDCNLEGGDDCNLKGGDYSSLKGGDDSALIGGYDTTLIGGYYSILEAGDGSTFMGGKGSRFMYLVGETKVIARVGENNILPNTKYILVNGKLTQV